MFPVPAHLPRSGGEALASNPDDVPSPPDPVLDLFSPLLSLSSTKESQPTGLSVQQASSIRRELQKAVDDNKARTHELLISNFPSISSHIRLGTESQRDFARIREEVDTLDSQVDPLNTQTSFIPPVLSQLKRHFDAVERQSRAKVHLGALRGLRGRAEILSKLESAIHDGRGADPWVIEELEGLETGFETLNGYEILQGTKALHASQARTRLLKSMLAEQVADGFAKIVAFSAPSNGSSTTTLTVSPSVSLPRPRSSATSSTIASASSSTATYPLPEIYQALHRLDKLSSTLSTLRQRLLRDIIQPLLTTEEPCRLVVKSAPQGQVASTLHTERAEAPPEPTTIIHDVTLALQFVDSTVFPATPSPLLEREKFLLNVRTSVLHALLDHLILPSIPSNYTGVAPWLSTVERAVQCEKDIGVIADSRVIQPFFTSKAGAAWADQRRQAIDDEVRQLIIGGWGGWDVVELEHEREVTSVVEIEVDEDLGVNTHNGNQLTQKPAVPAESTSESFGWGFEDDKRDLPSSTKKDETMEVDTEFGWDFNDTASTEAGPSRRRTPSPSLVEKNGASTGDDGWDFEVPIKPAEDPAPPPKLKPAREAKRLGKKVAKVKAAVDDDPWGSGTESVASSSKPPNGHDVDAGIATPTQDSQDDRWGWDDGPGASQAPLQASARSEPAPALVVKSKKRVLKEEKRWIRETILVSKTCARLLDIAEAALKEASELADANLTSPSFENIDGVLYSATTDIFDLYRSLIPAVFANQLRDVPTIAMQAYNDSLHLQSAVSALATRYPAWQQAEDVAERLMAAGSHIFESQLVGQRDGLLETLDEAAGFVETSDERKYRICERSVEQVVHNLESLARVLKAVLPATTYLDVLGYLLDIVAARISADLLALEDITEVESNRLHDLIKLIMPLENIFVLEPPQSSSIVAQVPHWLKLCYILELLQANLVDITYLFDTGALVDFTTEELVRVIRALFANSEKREKAIEKVEAGRMGVPA